MARTAGGLERRGHAVWILSHPRSRFTDSAPGHLKVIARRLGADYNPFAIAYLVRVVRGHGIDVLVTNIEKEVIAGGIAARLAGIPNVRRVGREDDYSSRWRVRAHHRFLVDHCIVPCDLVRENAIGRAPWLDRREFTTIYNGRDVREFSSEDILTRRRKWGLSADEGVIGVTCRLKGVKSVDSLIRAFQSVHERCPGWRLVITGEGPERSALEGLASGLGLRDQVIFAGFSADPMLSAAAYDIAVSPSRFEGFPNTVVEYLAAGKPVVSTDAGGVEEILTDGENGMLVGCGDLSGLSDRLVYLAGSPGVRRSLSDRARETIRRGFSEESMIGKLEALLADVIESHRRRSGKSV